MTSERTAVGSVAGSVDGSVAGAVAGAAASGAIAGSVAGAQPGAVASGDEAAPDIEAAPGSAAATDIEAQPAAATLGDEAAPADEGTLRIFGTANDSIVDGPGIRFALFLQGCARHCPGCHNPESWEYQGGFAVSTAELLQTIRANPLLAGVTLSGGEPFDQAERLLPFLRRLRAELPQLNVWAYSGYLFHELCDEDAVAGGSALLELIDVLVDGPYLHDERSLGLRWRGSANQRIIDVPASLKSGGVVLYE